MFNRLQEVHQYYINLTADSLFSYTKFAAKSEYVQIFYDEFQQVNNEIISLITNEDLLMIHFSVI